ncbi:hypothetical protein BLNAU_21802 [Blattamonas nauphoetae]|uniref:Uncharacterized protein n=1 Tax=Blattamonas nauphoetae TaxID=2049346 RepID=A0ABQ9WVD7_9EUKA|nr:hypothetical protein BLNAU_21802 [Blattamonas nauphoetae]
MERLARAGPSQSGIIGLRQFFHVEDQDSKRLFPFDMNVMTERLMSLLFENVCRSISMHSSTGDAPSVPLPHMRALNFLLSYNANIRLFIHRARMLQPPPFSFVTPPYISHSLTYLLGLDDTFIPRMEYQLPFFTTHTSHFKDLFNASVNFLSDVIGTDGDEIIHTRFVTLTTSSVRQTMRVLDKLIATRKNTDKSEDEKGVGFEESFLQNKQEWIAFLNHPHPVSQPLPDNLDDYLLPIERFIIFRQFIPHEALNCLIQMSETSLTFANLPSHPLETIISRAIQTTHPSSPLVLVTPPSLVDLSHQLKYVTKTTDITPLSGVPPVVMASIPISSEVGQHTLIDFIAPLNIHFSFSLFGPIPNADLSLRFFQEMIKTGAARPRNRNTASPLHLDRGAVLRTSLHVPSQHDRAIIIHHSLSTHLNPLLPVPTMSPEIRFTRREFQQKRIAQIEFSRNAVRRHVSFLYSKSQLISNLKADSDLDDILLSQQRFPIFPDRDNGYV